MRKTILRAMGVVALAGMGMPSLVSAGYINVYGSPTYTPASGGFVGNRVGGANTAGTAAGSAIKYDGSGLNIGSRAVRWDSTGIGVELGNLGTDTNGFTLTEANAINTIGTAVGTAWKFEGSGVFKGSRAVRWDRSGTTAVELGNLGTDPSGFTLGAAFAINTAGTAVGRADKFDGSGVYKGDGPVRWDSFGIAVELANLGTDPDGRSFSLPVAINAAGTAVGSITKYDGSGVSKGDRAVRWDGSGSAIVELGNLGTDAGGFTSTGAYAVNDAGTAVGFAVKYKGGVSSVAVRWDSSGTAVELGNLGTDPNGATESNASAINAAGTAVGYAARWNGSVNKGSRAVRWNASGTAATELGNLGTDTTGTTYGDAGAINSAGAAVGSAQAYDHAGKYLGDKAIYWGPNGLAVDLNTLIDPASGWTLLGASSISDTNWISGIGTFDPDGPGGQSPYQRLFLLQVPEPTSLTLLNFGGVVLLRRRRART